MIRAISILALADLGIFSAALGQSPASSSTLWFAPVHIGLTFAALLMWRGQSIGSLGWDGLALPLGAAIGPCGMLVLFLLKPWSRIGRRTKPLAYSPATASKPHSRSTVTPMVAMARMLDKRVCFPAADRIESLVTVLRHGSLPARRKALETAVRSFEPRLSPLIATALTDRDQTIRALAAAAAAEVSYNLTERRAELEARIGPDENPDDIYALAMLLSDHGCHNVLLSQAQRVQLCQKAYACLQTLACRLPADDQRHEAVWSALAVLGAEPLMRAASKPRAVRLRAVGSSDDRRPGA